MTTEIIVGKMAVNQEHQIEPQILENATTALEGAAARFSIDVISDAKVRINYMENIQRMAEEVRAKVNSKQITVKEGAEFCSKMRNKIMIEAREVTSAQGLAIAVNKKATGMSFQEALNKYANKIFSKNYALLTEQQKTKIYYAVIESSARDNKDFTTSNKRLKILGKVGILVTATLAAHAIIYSDNKPKELVRQGLGIGGGFAGGLVAALTVSAVCGPGAPVCAVAVVLAGSIAGGFAGSYVADTLDEEIEEFSKWQIR